MKEFSLILIVCLAAKFCSAQEYELISTSKTEELMTRETMDTILSKVSQLQHSTETVYYQLSEFTTILIYPKIRELKKEEE